MTKKHSFFLFLFILVATLALFVLFAEVSFAQQLNDPNYTFDLGVFTNDNITGTVRQRWQREGINYFFGRVIGFLSAIIGGVALLVMSYGGFLILSSAGSEDQYQKGVDYVKYSAIGLVVALGAYVLVNAVQLLINSIYA